MKLNVPALDEHAQTRRQLLEAAGAVFAERGFRNATVREICTRAGANIAAVNYHFGDKEKLYVEVFRYSRDKDMERFPQLQQPSELPPEKQLHEFILTVLRRIFDRGETSWHGQLMFREMIEPTAALDYVVAEKMRPLSQHIRRIVAALIGGRAEDERVRRCSFSVVSQCVFYCHCRSIVERLDGPEPFDAKALERLAEHIAKFSLAGLKAFRAAKK